MTMVYLVCPHCGGTVEHTLAEECDRLTLAWCQTCFCVHELPLAIKSVEPIPVADTYSDHSHCSDDGGAC